MAHIDREARERFAANVERLRRRDGPTVEELADRARIDPRELTEILGGKREAGYATIARLAAALGAEPDDLLRGIRWIPPGADGQGRFEVEGSDGE